MRPRGVLRVRRPGLGALPLDLWTKLDGARCGGGGARGAFSLWSVPATPHGRRGSPARGPCAAVGEDSMATNGDRKARGGLYT